MTKNLSLRFKRNGRFLIYSVLLIFLKEIDYVAVALVVIG